MEIMKYILGLGGWGWMWMGTVWLVGVMVGWGGRGLLCVLIWFFYVHTYRLKWIPSSPVKAHSKYNHTAMSATAIRWSTVHKRQLWQVAMLATWMMNYDCAMWVAWIIFLEIFSCNMRVTDNVFRPYCGMAVFLWCVFDIQHICCCSALYYCGLYQLQWNLFITTA